jgi:hypothetical protein
LNNSRYGEATLFLIKNVAKNTRSSFGTKFHPDNIVSAKLQIVLSDGSVHSIDSDILSLEWKDSDE